MDSFIPSFSNLGTPAPLPLFTTVVLKTIPPELLDLPSGALLPAVITPLEKPSDGAIIHFMLPDGGEVAIEAKITPVIEEQIAVSIKISPSESKETLGLKVFFETPVPNMEDTLEALLPSVVEEAESVEVLPPKTMTSKAFMLSSVPEQITALLPEIVGDLPDIQNSGAKMLVEIMPEHNALPALGQTEASTAEPSFLTTSLPKAPEAELVKVLELPKGEMVLKNEDIPPVPTSTNSQASGTATPLPLLEGLEQNLETPPVLGDAYPVLTETPQISVEPQGQKEDFTVVLQTAKNEIKKIGEGAKKELFEGIKSLFKFASKNTTHTVSLTEIPPPVKAEETQPTSVEKIAVNEPFKGVIFSPEQGEETFIATPKGVFNLEEKIQLPHLTPVLVKVLSFFDAKGAAVVSEEAPLPVFKNTWDVLSETLETLKETDEVAFEQVKNVLPQTGQKLPALMLGFMNSATHGASFSSLMGEANVLALKSMGEKGERLLKRLEKEFSTSSKKATDGQRSWKGLDIPILSGAMIEPVHLYLEAPSSQTERNASLAPINRNSQRFVLDLNLSKLGKIQIEGLSQKEERLFNMILRHKEKMPEGFELRVSAIFTETLSALNYAGALKVDETDDFLIFKPEEEDELFKQGVLV